MCVCISDQLLLLLVLPRHKSHVRRISIGIPTVCERQIDAHVLLSGERGTVLVLGREQRKKESLRKALTEFVCGRFILKI